jgi:hypothetical protein
VSSSSKYRSRQIANSVIGFSISYQRDNLLARGLGLEHIRELLLRLARPMLRQGASLAYGGHWNETEDNFTYDLLRLINAEQEDNSLGGPDTNLTIGRLFNHSSWPYYLGITPNIEAQWINCCRIVRITQKDAGFTPDETVADAEAQSKTPRAIFNSAATLSATRRLMMQPWSIVVPEFSQPEQIPPVVARVTLGGKDTSFSGFMPGIFEETLATLEASRPLYLLGGFGGATETLAKAILAPPGTPRPQEFTTAWHEEKTPGYRELLQSATTFALPPLVPLATVAFDLLWDKIEQARTRPSDILQTGLTDDQTRELLVTRDTNAAVRRVREGLTNQQKLPMLPA